MERDDLVRMHRLRVAGLAFAVGSAVHVLDHLRRGQGSVSETLFALGNLALVLQVLTVTLIATRHPRAPVVAAVVGPALAIGFAGAHWLPRWSAASDPLWEIDSWQWFSAIASAAEIAGAVAVGVTGAAIVLQGDRRPLVQHSR